MRIYRKLFPNLARITNTWGPAKWLMLPFVLGVWWCLIATLVQGGMAQLGFVADPVFW